LNKLPTFGGFAHGVSEGAGHRFEDFRADIVAALFSVSPAVHRWPGADRIEQRPVALFDV
jgi:hypothetical protein